MSTPRVRSNEKTGGLGLANHRDAVLLAQPVVFVHAQFVADLADHRAEQLSSVMKPTGRLPFSPVSAKCGAPVEHEHINRL